MRIAFTHNVQVTSSEDEAEFDTPATVAGLTAALRSLGHEVEPIEVSGPASRVVARLEAQSPELVFNTAEGTRGRFREAFFPALFDRLGMPFTGSDAYTCALTLDKQLTKLVLAQHGIPVAKGTLVRQLRELDELGLRLPVIVKPNYEGSSMGIRADSVVDDVHALQAKVADLLSQYPAGVLVEEYVIGRDIVVPFLEKASPDTFGVLEPAGYEFDMSQLAPRKYAVYDLELKTVASDAVEVKVPAGLPETTRRALLETSRKVFDVLQVRDLGRIDYRVRDDGSFCFLELNALPSLETGAALYRCAALAGLSRVEAVLDSVIRSASERYGIAYRPSRRPRPRVRVGLIYNLRAPTPEPNSVDERTAEYDSPETVQAIRQAIESYGHEVVELEATPELSALLPPSGIDVAFNIAEGIEGRARESQVPALLELLGIPYTGSDPTSIALSLDKGLAKRLVQQVGLLTPAFVLMATGKERLPKGWTFPAIVKPVAEGSSRGVTGASVVEDERALRQLVAEQSARYRQAMLVEAYLPGREFTLGLLGERKPRVLPPLEVRFTDASDKRPVYGFDNKFYSKGVELQVPAQVDSALGKELQRVARAAFIALGCRDVARIDLRLDAEGRAHFIECNPLPGLAPGFSDLCLIANASGMEYRTLIGEIMASALRRMRERKRQRD
ncbi:MAG: D-alanine--D-alanine ligase [Polyangiales bacterium]